MTRLVQVIYLSETSNVHQNARSVNRPKLWPKLVNCGGPFYCGTSTLILYARIVSELRVEVDPWRGEENVSWREPDSHKQNRFTYEIESSPGERRMLRRKTAPLNNENSLIEKS